MIWLSADLHFGHANIVKYCDRPYKNVTEMNEGIIANWNAVVKPTDTAYLLGDMAMSKKYLHLLHRLKGKKHLIIGNHDEPFLDELPQYFESMSHIKEFKHQGQKFILCHYAMRAWHHHGKGSIHLYGHSHGSLPGFERSMDVGVDAHNMCPISIDQVIRILAVPNNYKRDNHSSN